MRRFIISIVFAAPLAVFAAPPPSTPELIAKGKATFTSTCAPCHGDKGHGDGPAAVALNPKPRDYTKDALKNGDRPEDIFKTLTEGLKNTQMVSFAHLPEADRWALVYYVLELRKAGQPAAAALPDAGVKAAKKGPAAKK